MSLELDSRLHKIWFTANLESLPINILPQGEGRGAGLGERGQPQFKYLGVILDPSLTWNDHIDYIASKNII